MVSIRETWIIMLLSLMIQLPLGQVSFHFIAIYLLINSLEMQIATN